MPVVIQTGFVGIGPDLTYPRIGWEKATGTVATTNAAEAGFNGNNANTPLTYTAWQPSAVPSAWRLTFASARAISYVGIAVHNAGTKGATLTLQKRVGGVWSSWGGGTAISPTTDDAILFLLMPESVEGIGIEVTGAVCRIGVIAGGTVMEWPRKARWTGLPITESRVFDYETNESNTGNWLGRTLKASGLEFQVQIENLPETFRTGDFKAFAAHANTGDATFFIAPRPLGYLDEVAYAWSPGRVNMERAIPNKTVSGAVSLDLIGYRAP